MDLSKENRRILIIDDDKNIWKAYQLVLNPENMTTGSSIRELAGLIDTTPVPDKHPVVFELNYAGQGEEGYGLIKTALDRNQPYALAFIDIRMPPGWDGVKTAARIRAIDPNIEIVIVTAFSDHSLEEIVQRVGAPDKLLFFRKPFDPDALRQLAVSLISKRFLARQEEAQRKALETVLNTSPAAIFTIDNGKHISSWNPAAEKITGFKADEVIGKPCIFQRLTDDAHCQDCKGSEPFKIADQNRQLIIKDKNGTEKNISLFTVHIQGNESSPQGIIGNFWDITTIKNTERALSTSESRFRTLVETTSDLVWEVDVHGRFTYCSPVCRDLYEYAPEELLGNFFFEIPQPVNLNDNQTKNLFTECVRKSARCQPIERAVFKKSGELLMIESSGNPVFNEDGEVIGFRGIDRDITSRKKAETERQLLEEQYRQAQKLEALGTLAGGISHDLNNILTPIIGFTQICLQELGSAHPLKANLQSIEKCALKAADLIKQILAFSRKQEIETRPTDLNDLIQDFSQMLRRLLREDIELLIETNDSIWSIDADKGQAEQILVNLVVNARDAMPRGGRLTIRTKNQTIPVEARLFDVDHKPIDGDFAVLSVIDNGSGIDSKTMDLIFDPFFTTKEVGKGTGLGLATVHGIVLKHRGHITVTSHLGQGTTFQIYFPKGRKIDSRTCQPDINAPLMRGDETILIVEDAEEVLNLLSHIMEKNGYTVLRARNGNEALQYFKQQGDSIALLATDLIMPELGGLALVDRIRHTAPKLPVLFMSGHSFDPDIDKIVNGPCTSFIKKPFSLPEFTAKVRTMIDSC